MVYEAQKYSRNIPNAIAGAILYKKARQLWQMTWLVDVETGVTSTINGQRYCLGMYREAPFHPAFGSKLSLPGGRCLNPGTET